MPIYEYICCDCGKHFEALRSMREADAPIECQRCAGLHTRRNVAVKVATGGRAGAVAATTTASSGGCGGCSGGSCASCGH